MNAIVPDDITHPGCFDSLYTYIGTKDSCQTGKTLQQFLLLFILLYISDKAPVNLDRPS